MDSDLKLVVNGEAQEVPEGTTILTLLVHLKIPGEQVAVEVNNQVIRRARHAEHRLASGDQVEIVAFVGGG